MSYLINLEQDMQTTRSREFAEEWIKKMVRHIWVFMKENFVQPTLIHKFQLQNLDLNGCRGLIEFISVYQQIFKILVTVEFTFFIHFQTHIKYTIISPHNEIMKYFPQLQQSINELKDIQRNSQGFFKLTNSDGLTVEQRYYFHPIPTLFHAYVQHIFKILKQPYQICQSILQEIKTISHDLFKPYEQTYENNIDPLKALKKLRLVEKENQIFREFYRNQNKGRSSFKNPSEIDEKNHQILRNVIFYKRKKRKELAMTKDLNQRFQGSFSSLTYIQTYGGIINSFYQQRSNSYEEENLEDYQPGKKDSFYRLVRKRVGGKQSLKQAAYASLRNELEYLKLKGNFRVPYICNYYFQFILSSNSPPHQQVRGQPQEQLYCDFHQTSIWQIFYKNRPFTLLDLINFGEQLMTGLKEFYLDLGYLHRDVKELNIMVSKDKIIQIIDHGSVYPFARQTQSKIIKEEKIKFNPQLRSTLFVKQKIFREDSHLVAKYKTWIKYRNQSATHRTFDVYSVGTMLKEIMADYELFPLPKWMEIHQRINRLVQKMIQKDFELRIQMEDALTELKAIRKFIFQEPNS